MMAENNPIPVIIILIAFAAMIMFITHKSIDKGFLTCYLDKGIILSKYGDVKFESDTWTVSGKSFTYTTNSKCLFVKDMKS